MTNKPNSAADPNKTAFPTRRQFVALTRSKRPILLEDSILFAPFLMRYFSWFSYRVCLSVPRWSNQMTALDHYFGNSSLAPICRCELALLQAALGEQVVSLLEGNGKVSKFVVKRQAVPVCVSFNLLVLALKAIAFAKPGVSYFGS